MKAAEQGHAGAQYRLALMYYTGNGVVKSAKKGLEWMTKAAEQGDAKTQCDIGMCYTIPTFSVAGSVKDNIWCLSEDKDVLYVVRLPP